MLRFDQTQITRIHEIRTVSSLRGKFLERTAREHYGLSFCIEGQITYTQNEKRFLSDPSRAILIPKDSSYRLYGEKKGLFPLINFDCTGLELNTIYEIPLQNPAPFLKDYEQMKQLFLFERNHLKVMSIFYEMLSRLSDIENRQGALPAGLIAYLEEHISDPALSNQMLARQIGFSEIYFRKLFSAQFGTSPKQYIMDVRIRKAKQLLADGTLSVTAVSEACGFSSVYHFSRTFKERVGVTPTQYILEHQTFHI